MEENMIHSGFVSLIGRPNVGKSTLLNKMAGIRLAITSPKAQTTRQIVRAVLDEKDSQIIFLDSPGLHKPRTKLGEFMMAQATLALSDADVILLLVDAEASIRHHAMRQVPVIEANILEKCEKMDKPVILVINKVDQVVKQNVLPMIEAYSQRFKFEAIVPVSALSGDGVDRLSALIRSLLPEGPRYYPADSLTDQTERSITAELIREQILMLTHEEIPHGTAVEIESFEETLKGEPLDEEHGHDRDFVSISALVYCDRDTHKGILIGKQGSMLKRIGSRARQEIETLLGCKVYLEIHVKVREDWRNRRGILKNLGYNLKD